MVSRTTRHGSKLIFISSLPCGKFYTVKKKEYYRHVLLYSQEEGILQTCTLIKIRNLRSMPGGRVKRVTQKIAGWSTKGMQIAVCDETALEGRDISW